MNIKYKENNITQTKKKKYAYMCLKKVFFMYPDFFLSVQQEPNEIMKWEYHRIAGFKGLKLKTLIALIG